MDSGRGSAMVQVSARAAGAWEGGRASEKSSGPRRRVLQSVSPGECCRGQPRCWHFNSRARARGARPAGRAAARRVMCAADGDGAPLRAEGIPNSKARGVGGKQGLHVAGSGSPRSARGAGSRRPPGSRLRKAKQVRANQAEERKQVVGPRAVVSAGRAADSRSGAARAEISRPSLNRAGALRARLTAAAAA